MDKNITLRDFLSTLLDDGNIHRVTIDFGQYSTTLFPGVFIYSLPYNILKRKVKESSIVESDIFIKLEEN